MKGIGTFDRPCPTQDELELLADRPTVQKFEAVELIQGLLPTRAVVSYLSDYELPAKKLLKAFEMGELTNPTTPEKFVRWCIDNEVALPEHYVKKVLARIFHLRRPKSPTRYTDERIWMPSLRGRPRSKWSSAHRGLENDIIRRAKEVLLAYVKRTGQLPMKATVTREIALKTGRDPKIINRSYNLKTCATPAEIAAARRSYRVQFHKNLEKK